MIISHLPDSQRSITRVKVNSQLTVIDGHWPVKWSMTFPPPKYGVSLTATAKNRSQRTNMPNEADRSLPIMVTIGTSQSKVTVNLLTVDHTFWRSMTLLTVTWPAHHSPRTPDYRWRQGQMKSLKNPDNMFGQKFKFFSKMFGPDQASDLQKRLFCSDQPFWPGKKNNFSYFTENYVLNTKYY